MWASVWQTNRIVHRLVCGDSDSFIDLSSEPHSQMFIAASVSRWHRHQELLEALLSVSACYLLPSQFVASTTVAPVLLVIVIYDKHRRTRESRMWKMDWGMNRVKSALVNICDNVVHIAMTVRGRWPSVNHSRNISWFIFFPVAGSRHQGSGQWNRMWNMQRRLPWIRAASLEVCILHFYIHSFIQLSSIRYGWAQRS